MLTHYFLKKRSFPLEVEGLINRASAEAASRSNDIEDAAMELAQMLVEQEDAIVELAELIEGGNE